MLNICIVEKLFYFPKFLLPISSLIENFSHIFFGEKKLVYVVLDLLFYFSTPFFFFAAAFAGVYKFHNHSFYAKQIVYNMPM
jgi:hypothetical protein